MTAKPSYEALERRVAELEREMGRLRDGETAVQPHASSWLHRSLFDHINDAVYIHGILPDGEPGRFLQVNRAASEMLGYSVEELLARSPRELDDPEKAARYIPAAMAKLRREGAARFEAVQVAKSGRRVDVEVNSVVRRLGDETVILSVCRDITERKRVVEELREKEQFLEAIYHHVSHSIFVVDVCGDGDYRYVDLNPRHERLTGISSEAIRGKSPHEILPAEAASRVAERYGDCVGAQRPIRYEEWLPFNGENTCWETTLHPLKDGSGRVCRIIGTSHEITERKRMEVSLRESETKYRTMMEAMDEAAYICSPDLRIEYMNPAMVRKVGRDATDERCYRAIHGLTQQCPWCDHRRVMDGETVKAELVKGDGEEVFFVSHSPIHHANGSISKLTIYRDITEQKKLETRMQQAQKMEAVGTLAGGIAHDFNNILFPIIGMAEMLLEDLAPGSPEHENAEEIYRAGRRGRDLVNRILAFSRQSENRPIPVAVQKILKEALKLSRSSIPSNIEIVQRIQRDCGLVMADPTQIHQIAMNLITNAYHAVEDNGGRISVELAEVRLTADAPPDGSLAPGRYVQLTVADNGHGIDPGIVDKIFEPYFTTKRKGKGTGLGLATVHGIARAHGGDIRVTSEPGGGAVFTVRLPVPEERSDGEALPAEAPRPTGSEHILLVDDEEPVIKLVRKMLERLGYRVTARVGSVEALEAFKADPGRFDLVISDMAMPNMTGDLLAEALLAIRPDLPILICTGFSEKIDAGKAAAMGVRGLLPKPVLQSEMAAMVRSLLDAGKKGGGRR